MGRNPLRSLRPIVPAAALPDVLRYADSAHQSPWQNSKKIFHLRRIFSNFAKPPERLHKANKPTNNNK